MHSLSSGSVFKTWSISAFAIVAGVTVGCGGPGRVAVPTYDPEAMARAAMVEYDKNGDGKLDAAELEACPGLKDTARQLAADTRGGLKEDEIAERMRDFRESKIGLRVVRCTVSRGTQAIAGATVTYVPEKFMGGSIKAATGVTDANGNVQPRVEGETVDGLSLGYYRIEVSLKDPAGMETIPEQFNAKTKLGQEIHHRRQESAQVNIE